MYRLLDESGKELDSAQWSGPPHAIVWALQRRKALGLKTLQLVCDETAGGVA